MSVSLGRLELTRASMELSSVTMLCMTKPNAGKPRLTIIEGSRDGLEMALARALFGPDKTEIDRCADRLNQISNKTPKLKLHINLTTTPKTPI